MKIAIHHRKGSFSDRWIACCEKKNIPYKIVNVFDSDIVRHLHDCDALMWHHHHAIYKDVIAAKKILFALEHAGIKVFPDFRTGWHFDDKVAQKYFLEAIDAPIVPSYVFYDRQDAINWARQTGYPKVFKLKGGAGAANVSLVRSEKEALRLIKKAFGKGFPQYNRFSALAERYRKFKEKQVPLIYVLKGFGRLFITPSFANQQPNERGYVYFQDFVPNNNYDLRVIVIGNKAFSIKRMVRKNDFRASGSGMIEFGKKSQDEECIRLAFEVNKRINAQSVAYDFIYGVDRKPLIVEICYGYVVELYNACPGYWDKDMSWHEGKFIPQEWMVDELLSGKQAWAGFK